MESPTNQSLAIEHKLQTRIGNDAIARRRPCAGRRDVTTEGFIALIRRFDLHCVGDGLPVLHLVIEPSLGLGERLAHNNVEVLFAQILDRVGPLNAQATGARGRSSWPRG
jgi:hypothetical protein